MDEAVYNPRRRYRDFRPREAMRGRSITGVPTNRATVSLYNNSTGRAALVVRDLSMSGTANDTVAISYVGGQVGSTAGLQAALVANEAVFAGLVASIDTTTVYPGDYIAPLSAQGIFIWTHDFPLGVVQPGYSMTFQCSTAAHALTLALVWESVEIDQLDYFH